MLACLSSACARADMAAEEGHDACVSLLLHKDAALSMESKDKAGCTALFRACQNGCDKVVPVLLRAGADPETTRKDGFTSLMTAVQAVQPLILAQPPTVAPE